MRTTDLDDRKLRVRRDIRGDYDIARNTCMRFLTFELFVGNMMRVKYCT